MADQRHHDAPMHRRGSAADGGEAGDAPSCAAPVHATRRQGRRDGREHVRADGRSDGRPRTICICVDDFGLHAGINEAALRLAALGRVHAIGCLVACLVGGGARRDPWAGALRDLDRGSIDIGLHLDVSECPLLPGSRRSLPSLIALSMLRRLDRSIIRAEIRAQLDTFEQALGRAPAFVDGHRHVHQLAVVRRELLDELAHRYPGARPWLRSTRSAGVAIASGMGHWPTMLKARGIALLGASGLDSAARRMGFAQNRRLLGVYDFKGGPERYRELMSAWVRAAADADLLMCHAGLHPHEGDPIAEARQAEFAVLAGAPAATMLHDAAVRLAPMSRILARRTAQDAPQD